MYWNVWFLNFFLSGSIYATLKLEEKKDKNKENDVIKKIEKK